MAKTPINNQYVSYRAIHRAKVKQAKQARKHLLPVLTTKPLVSAKKAKKDAHRAKMMARATRVAEPAPKVEKKKYTTKMSD